MIEKNNFWVGVVENRKDPLKLGRCKVRVFGSHTETLQELPTETLNWAHPVLPLNNPNPYAPKEGDIVVGFFMDGEESQFPMMLGVLPGIPTGKANTTYGFNDLRTEEELKKAPKKPEAIGEGAGQYPRVIDEPTTSKLARNESVANSQFQIKRNNIIPGSPEVVSPLKTVYPYNNVYESESGHVLEFDDTPEAERVHLFHRSGTYKEFLPNGDSTEKTQGAKTDTIKGKSTIYVGEDLMVIVKGDTTYQVDGDFTVSCKNFNVAAGGSGSISSKVKLSLSTQAMATLSSKGYTSVSALGYLSMSAKGYASMSALGPAKITSKSVIDVGAPLVNIGILGAAVPEEAKDAVGESAQAAAETAATTASESMVSSLGSLIGVDVSSFADFSSLTGFTSLDPGALASISDSFGGILGNTGGFFDSLSSTFGEAFGGLSDAISGLDFSSFSAFSDSFGALKDSFGSVTDLAGQFQDIAGTISSAIADPLGTIMNSGLPDVLGNAFDSLGAGLTDLPGADFLSSTKDLFDGAKEAFDLGTSFLSEGNFLDALPNLGKAADVIGGTGFLDNVSSAFSTVTSAIRNNTISSAFSDIMDLTGSADGLLSNISNTITPAFNSFVDAAGIDFRGSMPDIPGVSSVIDRVSESMKSNLDIKNGVSRLIADGFATGTSQAEIQSNISTYLTNSFSDSVTSEMSASPITFLNVLENTGATA